MTKYSIDQFSGITGITKFVLRTWENRYGFLKADRTKTNIRVYTDAMVVRALNTNYLLNSGKKISKISKLSDHEMMEAVVELKISDLGSKEDFYVNEIIISALQFDSVKFNSVYNQGVEEFGIVDFYNKVILQTMQKIGILWLTNRVAPSQEHFLSELFKQKIAVATDESFNTKKINNTWLLFLPENEFHEIGLLFAKLLLVQYGYNVIFLGPNVPYGSLLQVAENKKIDNTLLFSVSNSSKNNLNFTIQYLEANFKDTQHYIVSNDTSLDLESVETKVSILNSLDQFIDIISK